MKNGFKTVIIAITLLSALNIAAQDPDSFRSISFKLVRNRVILPVTIGESRNLDIILDTGMRFEGVYLFHKGLVDEIGITNGVEVRVGGAGSGEASYAIMADSMTLKSGSMEFHNQRVVIAQSDISQKFSTDGVIGYTLFHSYAVEIDYDKMIITLHDPSEFTPDSTWEAIPLNLKEDIPFLKAEVNIYGEDAISIDVYIDLGAGEALELLVRPDMKFQLPEGLSDDKYLGTGLSGDITGKVGRISSMKIGSFLLTDVITAFPPADVRSKQEGADGIICNDALRRFNVVFDYSRQILYVKPNSHFHDPFE